VARPEPTLQGPIGGERFPDFEAWDRICKLYAWRHTSVGTKFADSAATSGS